MDSIPTAPDPQSQPQPLKPTFSSASKLPIKRKTPPQLEFEPVVLAPTPLHASVSASASAASVSASVSASAASVSASAASVSASAGFKPSPPFKFHRIWTEPDEISFLQSLLLHSHLTIDDLSSSLSYPFTKSQLSDKLRRLRKKFRLLSSRLHRGLPLSSLPPHDQALFHLSKCLWTPHPDSDVIHHDHHLAVPDRYGNGVMRIDDGVVVKTVLDVFDQCLNDVQTLFSKQKQGMGMGMVLMDSMEMERKWKEQRVSELGVLGSRLRLVIEDSLLSRP